eukprot:g1565.t1
MLIKNFIALGIAGYQSFFTPIEKVSTSTHSKIANNVLRLELFEPTDTSCSNKVTDSVVFINKCAGGPTVAPNGAVSADIRCTQTECVESTYNSTDCSGAGTKAFSVSTDGKCEPVGIEVGSRTVKYNAIASLASLDDVIKSYRRPMLSSFPTSDCSGDPFMIVEQGFCRTYTWNGGKSSTTFQCTADAVQTCTYDDEDSCDDSSKANCQEIPGFKPDVCKSAESGSVKYVCSK